MRRLLSYWRCVTYPVWCLLHYRSMQSYCGFPRSIGQLWRLGVELGRIYWPGGPR